MPASGKTIYAYIYYIAKWKHTIDSKLEWDENFRICTDEGRKREKERELRDSLKAVIDYHVARKALEKVDVSTVGWFSYMNNIPPPHPPLVPTP